MRHSHRPTVYYQVIDTVVRCRDSHGTLKIIRRRQGVDWFFLVRDEDTRASRVLEKIGHRLAIWLLLAALKILDEWLPSTSEIFPRTLKFKEVVSFNEAWKGRKSFRLRFFWFFVESFETFGQASIITVRHEVFTILF